MAEEQQIVSGSGSVQPESTRPSPEEQEGKIQGWLILSPEGIVQFAENKETAEAILQLFRDQGLLRYFTFQYSWRHSVGVAEFYQNDVVVVKPFSISSTVGRVKVELRPKYLRKLFEIPKEASAGDYVNHEIKPKELWDRIKKDSAPKDPTFTGKKKELLSHDFERALDVLVRFIEGKVAGTNEVSHNRIRMLNSVLNGFKTNWALMIFAFLTSQIEKSVKNGVIQQVVGFGFMISQLLKSKLIKRNTINLS